MRKLLVIISSFAMALMLHFMPNAQLGATENHCQVGTETSDCQYVEPIIEDGKEYFGGFYCVHDPDAPDCQC